MKAGDLFHKVFTETLGIKADDPDLKSFISDPELAKTEIASVADFLGHFMTFQQAKANKAIIQEIEESAKKKAYGEFIGNAEGTLRKFATDNGISSDQINQIFKDNDRQDKKLTAVMKLIDENARKASGQTVEEWKEEKKRLHEENRALTQKLHEETTRITDEFTGKLSAKDRQMILMEMKSALPGVMKFRSDIPGLSDLQGLKLQTLLEKYHIVKTADGFKFYDPADTSKEVFDSKGKPFEFNKLVGELFPIAEYGETGKTKTTAGKTTSVDDPGSKELPPEIADKKAAINSLRPSAQPVQ